MYEKKTLIILILNILKKYSDEDHHLTQKQVVELLEKDYDMVCDRRAVKSNIDALTDLGYEILYDDGYYLAERELDEAELRMLIDSVLSSQTLPAAAAGVLIKKLSGMGSRYFSPKVSHIAMVGDLHHTDNKQVMYSIDTIHDAISRGSKISFFYNTYRKDLKLHLRREEPFVVSPYQMFVKNRWYYLVGQPEGADSLFHFRLDRMVNVIRLSDRSDPVENIKGYESGINLPKHLAEHVYMFGGESEVIKFKTSEDMLDSVVDWFGKDIRITENDDGTLTIRIFSNKQAFFYWAIQFGLYVEVLSPEDLRVEIAQAVAAMNEKYNG